MTLSVIPKTDAVARLDTRPPGMRMVASFRIRVRIRVKG